MKKTKTKKPFKDYDSDNDILFINWGGKSEHSIELFKGNLILDINKKDEIVALEIMGFKEELDKFCDKLKEFRK